MKDTDIARFYALLGELDHQLGGPRRLRCCTASSGWPLNGVYFFFEEGEPPVSFETGAPLSDFGLLAWSLSWEMDIVNIIKTLRAAGMPARRCERDERHPILLVGGDIARMNPAALAPFVDVFALGDGERGTRNVGGVDRCGEEFLG